MKGKLHSVQDCVIVSFVLIISFLADLMAQTEQGQNLAQYLFPSFSKATITTGTGKPLSLILNYNTVSEKMVFEQKGQYYDITNPETADTAIIQNRKFIPYGNFFLEVILKDSVSFFVQHKSDLVEPGRPAGYGQTSQLTASNYVSGINTPTGYYNFKLPDGYKVRPSPVYWVKFKGGMQSFQGEKQFLKIFPERSDQLKKYIKENRIRFDRIDDLEKLINYCNELQ